MPVLRSMVVRTVFAVVGVVPVAVMMIAVLDSLGELRQGVWLAEAAGQVDGLALLLAVEVVEDRGVGDAVGAGGEGDHGVAQLAERHDVVVADKGEVVAFGVPGVGVEEAHGDGADQALLRKHLGGQHGGALMRVLHRYELTGKRLDVEHLAVGHVDGSQGGRWVAAGGGADDAAT
jgi:hypothetical protein